MLWPLVDGPENEEVLERTARRFRDAGILLPTFAELADPERIDPGLRERLAEVDPDQAHPLNLFRVHWRNDPARRDRWLPAPACLELPTSLTGVAAPILVALGRTFPLIRAHKVLAAYGCLVPRLVTGQFDPARHRALWPSTGNYCRGGVAISRILGCRGVAILPEGMSEERFHWLERWVASPEDIVRTPGSESNVKEIYDRCEELARDESAVVFNQFAEFGNYLAHHSVTGPALHRMFQQAPGSGGGRRLAAFVAATGSAGTLAAGDHLKAELGSRVVAAEPVECPTLLRAGYGTHNIQGIGDKHVPLIHNVGGTDLVVAVSDRATDRLAVLFNTPQGREYLVGRRQVPESVVARLGEIGLSGICNVVAAIKVARYLELGEEDAIVTVATDGAELYVSERERVLRQEFPRGLDPVAAAEIHGEHLAGAGTDHLLELTRIDRERIFNLGYFTWVEQRGVSLEAFDQRRRPEFWRELLRLVPRWDEQIRQLNRRSGLSPAR